MSAEDWWDAPIVMSGIGGVVVGLLFPIVHAWWRRRKERRGELFAMHVEMRRALECMQSLLSDEIKAPLYRLPLSMYTIALPKLIGEGNLGINEIGALLEYGMSTEELNRGLDRAGQAHAAGPNLANWLEEEFGRNRLKASKIIDKKQERYEGETVRDAAEAALFRLRKHHCHRDPTN